MRKREVILSTIKPSNKAQEDAVIAWLQVTLNIADLLAKPNLVKPEVSCYIFELLSASSTNRRTIADHIRFPANSSEPENKSTLNLRQTTLKSAERNLVN